MVVVTAHNYVQGQLSTPQGVSKVKYDILLAGMGGQGLILLSAVLGEACTANEIKIVTEEQHGLAQRSGSITAHVRIGEAYSPMIPYGEADLIIQACQRPGVKACLLTSGKATGVSSAGSGQPGLVACFWA